MNPIHIKNYGEIKLYLTQGDITCIPTQAIITPINSAGLWFGGIDNAITKVAGNHYHAQAAAEMPLSDTDTVVATGSHGNGIAHIGKFKDVIFVVDDLQSPLDEVVYSGLVAANVHDYSNVLMPAMRTGVMAGKVEKTPRDVALKMGKGIEAFVKDYSPHNSLRNLTIVVYNSPIIMKSFEEILKEK